MAGLTRVDAVTELLTPFDATLMKRFAVSTRINFVKNDDPDCAADNRGIAIPERSPHSRPKEALNGVPGSSIRGSVTHPSCPILPNLDLNSATRDAIRNDVQRIETNFDAFRALEFRADDGIACCNSHAAVIMSEAVCGVSTLDTDQTY